MRFSHPTSVATTAVLLTALIGCLLASHCGVAVAAETPNVLLIVSDDQGYNDLGILNDEIITPNLDRLAREGTRLSNFYVTWPACTPSRSGFLTGRYPQRNGIYDMIRNEGPTMVTSTSRRSTRSALNVSAGWTSAK